MSAWTCAAHATTNTGDCPRCDDELIALIKPDDPPERCMPCRRGACSSCLADETGCGCCDPDQCPCSLPPFRPERGAE